MSLYVKDSGLCLIKDHERRTYTLTVFDKDSSRRIIWVTEQHKELTEFVDKKLFPDKK
jgi:hypothetical protein